MLAYVMFPSAVDLLDKPVNKLVFLSSGTSQLCTRCKELIFFQACQKAYLPLENPRMFLTHQLSDG